jgi:hypothetical protein
MARRSAVSFFQNPALERESNLHLIFQPSKAVERVQSEVENIRYIRTELTRMLLFRNNKLC